MSNPIFSIVIPAYNKAKELERCLSTVLGQTFAEIEVIVVDDGSTDETENVLSIFRQKDTRVSVIRHTENSSLLASRITGMKAAKGEYLLFVDADDYLELDTCERLYKWLKHKQCDIVEFAYQCEPYQDIEYYPTVPDDIPKAMMQILYPYTVWNKCYSIELIQRALEKIESFYCNMSEDGYFSIVFTVMAKSYERIGDCLYHYVIGEGMSTAVYHDKTQVDRAVASIQAKREHLSSFLKKNRTDLLEYLDGFYKNDLMSVWKLCIDAEDIEVQFELLKELDGLTEMEYLKQRKIQIADALKTLHPYQNTDIAGRNSLLFKAWRRDVLQAGIKRILKR